jgi:hypothetical protein
MYIKRCASLIYNTVKSEVSNCCARSWIDYLCTNQEDVLERNHKVGQIREIHSDASSVIIWLGLATEDLEQTFDDLDANESYDTQQRRQTIADSWWQLFRCAYWR